MTIQKLARRRLASQHLSGNPLATPQELVRRMCAIQAQDYPGAKWGIAQRVARATDRAIDELLDEGALLRTHVLRPTWHLVHPADIRWMLALSGPRVHASDASRRRQLELDDATLQRARKLITRELRDGNHRTRQELASLLERYTIATRDNRMAHILMHLELDAIICSGEFRGSAQTYALLDERVAPAPERDRDEALQDLTLRYFRTHGPATPHDCAWWSGLTVGDIRRAIGALGDELEELAYDGRSFWIAAGAGLPPKRRARMHLLPNWDEHIVAYRDHAPSLDPTIAWRKDPTADRVAPHVVTSDGLVVGGWRRVIKRGGVNVELDLRRELAPAERTALESAANEYMRFLGAEVTLDGGAIATSRTTTTVRK